LTKMQLDNQKEIAEMQNETQKEIAGIQSATSRQNTKDQVYAQNEMLAYQQKESTARVASIMENTNLSKQQQVSEIMRQMLTQAQTLNPQCLASISRWITASSSWKRFCLFVCRALSSIMVICMLTAIRLLLTFVMSL